MTAPVGSDVTVRPVAVDHSLPQGVILGVGGFLVPPPGDLRRAADVIRSFGGLYIADEVQTGFGRTGSKMWGIEHHDGVEPDIMTMAKGLSSGYAPIAAAIIPKTPTSVAMNAHARRVP